MALTNAQKVQTARLPGGHGYDLVKLEKWTTTQLRARVNVTSVSFGSTITVNYSAANDYTSAEMETIQENLVEGKPWRGQISDIVAKGRSIEQRLTALEA